MRLVVTIVSLFVSGDVLMVCCCVFVCDDGPWSCGVCLCVSWGCVPRVCVFWVCVWSWFFGVGRGVSWHARCRRPAQVVFGGDGEVQCVAGVGDILSWGVPALRGPRWCMVFPARWMMWGLVSREMSVPSLWPTLVSVRWASVSWVCGPVRCWGAGR